MHLSNIAAGPAVRLSSAILHPAFCTLTFDFAKLAMLGPAQGSMMPKHGQRPGR